jgi:hypothetical protein
MPFRITAILILVVLFVLTYYFDHMVLKAITFLFMLILAAILIIHLIVDSVNKKR